MKLNSSDMEMLKSCFTYGYIGWSNYYKELVAKYGQKTINNAVKQLEQGYKVIPNTYEDMEGVKYNTLQKV